MKRRVFSNVYYAISITILVVSLSAITTFAAEYHVTTTGNDSTGDGSIGNPWATPYAAEKLNSGDTLYIHAGTYSVNGGVSSGVQVVSGTTITNYPGDRPFLDTGSSPTGPTFVVNGDSNVTISGMKIRGMIWLDGGASNITIENNEVYGGGQTADDFGCLFFTAGVTTNHSNITIRNNYFHDNSNQVSSRNSPILQLYDTDTIVIEYNTFENSADSAIRLKDDQNDVVIRYNFFLNSGGADIEGGNQDQGYNVDIYNNVMVRNKANFRFGSIATESYLDNWNIYNNTIVGPINGIIASNTSQNINVWNNIVYDAVDYFIFTGGVGGATSYSDYNQFYDAGSGGVIDSDFDSNSITTNPNFINASGTDPEDFKRTSYPSDGRGGGYNAVIGAWLSDDTPSQIGAGDKLYTTPPPPEGTISAPRDFKIE